MSTLADQINELEDQLAFYKGSADDLAKEVDKLEQELEMANGYKDELEAFVEYIDKTHPELRVAFEAAQKLEGGRK